jgi:hypothetical protein
MSKALMPQTTPDFSRIALRLLIDLGGTRDAVYTGPAMAVVAEQLRLAWNARGAADLAIIELAAGLDAQTSVIVKQLDRALRTLDC